MAFIDDCFAEGRNEREERIRQERYDRFLEGKTDAAFGRVPEYNDPAYLEGYVAGVKELPADPDTKKIQQYTPPRSFAFGFVDSPDPCFYQSQSRSDEF